MCGTTTKPPITLDYSHTWLKKKLFHGPVTIWQNRFNIASVQLEYTLCAVLAIENGNVVEILENVRSSEPRKNRIYMLTYICRVTHFPHLCHSDLFDFATPGFGHPCDFLVQPSKKGIHRQSDLSLTRRKKAFNTPARVHSTDAIAGVNRPKVRLAEPHRRDPRMHLPYSSHR